VMEMNSGGRGHIDQTKTGIARGRRRCEDAKRKS
jgi:hypothetical protein